MAGTLRRFNVVMRHLGARQLASTAAISAVGTPAAAGRWTPWMGGTLPAPRSSHSVTSIVDKAGVKVAAVFGGEDSPRNAFDPSVHIVGHGGTLRDFAPAPAPAPLLGAAAAGVGSVLHIFGGRTGGTTCFDQDGETCSETEASTLLSIDVGSTSATPWCTLDATPNGPEPRSFHSMASLGSTIFVFGGCGADGRLNDLWCLDTEPATGSSLQWQCLHAGSGAERKGGVPPARGGSSLVALPATDEDPTPRLLLVCGFNGEQLGDLWEFSLPSSSALVHDTVVQGQWVDVTAQQQGDVPSARSVAAVTAVDEHTVFLFGGESVPSDDGHEGAGEFTNDAYILDTRTTTWTQIDSGSSIGSGGSGGNDDGRPTPRGWSGAATVSVEGGEEVLVVGGLDRNNARLGDAWSYRL